MPVKIDRIWTKIWEKIKDDPSLLNMRYFFSIEGVSEEGMHMPTPGFLNQCGSACCIIGHAAVIAREEGVEFDGCPVWDDNVSEMFGEPMTHEFNCVDEEEGSWDNSELYNVCYCYDDHSAYEYVRERANKEAQHV